MTVMLVSIRNRHLQINYVKLDIALVFVFEKKTTLYYQPVCIDARHLQRNYGAVGKLRPRLCKRALKIAKMIEEKN